MSIFKRVFILPVLAVLVLLLLIAVMAGYFNAKIEPGLAEPVGIADTSDAIEIVAQDSAVTETVPASVEAKEITIVSSRLLARITSIGVRAGDLVEADQLLLTLEKTDLLARAQQAREQIQSVEARLLEARQNLKRAQTLHQRNLISNADRDAAAANAAALEADVASLQQVLAEAEIAVSYSEIRSPIAGRIVDRFAEQGDTASPGQKLLSLYNPFSLRVEAWVREELALALQTGDVLQAEIPSTQQALVARIEEIVPAADPGSRSFLVRAILPPDRHLLPGMYARLQIPAGNRSRVMIPADRVARVGQLDVVWVARAGIVERRFVRLGQTTSQGTVEVVGGLLSGDLLLPPPS